MWTKWILQIKSDTKFHLLYICLYFKATLLGTWNFTTVFFNCRFHSPSEIHSCNWKEIPNNSLFTAHNVAFSKHIIWDIWLYRCHLNNPNIIWVSFPDIYINIWEAFFNFHGLLQCETLSMSIGKPWMILWTSCLRSPALGPGFGKQGPNVELAPSQKFSSCRLHWSSAHYSTQCFSSCMHPG